MSVQAARRRLVVLLACAATLGPAALLAVTPAAAAPAAPAALAPAAPAEPERPLVIVLDTSGSMAEDDGTGTIKLAGAQAALSQVIRQQRPGAQIGLWTYPGDGDCDGGSFAIPVSALDQRSMIAKIRGLSADGDTPTAEALRATVETLEADGYTGATVLLISDGLSTCESPCDAAKEVVAQGFDLTVQAAGFQISPDGLDELKCIADATGGDTYEATDGDELAEVTDQATRAALEVEVEGIPKRTPAGSASRVSVTVTNNSAIDIADARISMNFTNQGGTPGQTAVVPAVLPPLVRVGNIPTGESRQEDWVVSYGSRGKAGTASWKVAAWGSNAGAVSKTGTVDVQDLILGLQDGGGDIKALVGKRIAIVGDSYSSGEGAGTYLPNTDAGRWGQGNTCHKSTYTYLYSLFGEKNVELLACSGATTKYRSERHNGVQEEQVDLLADVQEDHGAVSAAFMSVGGNDVGFAGIVTNCLALHPTAYSTWSGPNVTFTTDCSSDTAWKKGVFKLIDQVGGDLTETYKQVYDSLNRADFVEERDGRVAPLYVLAYPQPFPEAQWAYYCRGFNLGEVAFANELLGRLNDRIAASVRSARKQGYRVEMIPDIEEVFLPDNTACPRPGATEYMNSVSAVEGGLVSAVDWLVGSHRASQFMHPNALGYQAETSSIIRWSVSAADERPDGVDSWRVAPKPNRWPDSLTLPAFAQAVTPGLPSAGTVTLQGSALELQSAPQDLRGGQGFDLVVEDAAPGSTMLVMVQSRAQLLGEIELDESGNGTGAITIPRSLPAGHHRVTLLGFDVDGNPVARSFEVDVSRALPFWLLPLAVLTLLALLSSWLLDRRHRRARAGAVPTDEESE